MDDRQLEMDKIYELILVIMEQLFRQLMLPHGIRINQLSYERFKLVMFLNYWILRFFGIY